jgi:prepilin-type N-terminal cleavage/methylation domain-containing protein
MKAAVKNWAGGGIFGLTFGNSGGSGAGAALGMDARSMFFLRLRTQGRVGGAKRIGEVRKHKGFTLVEVIVVLVILAILAAIAIPALTGYIDKAKLRSVDQQVTTYRQAVMTMIIEAMAENGGSALLAAQKSFTSVSNLTPSATDPSNTLYATGSLSSTGQAEYMKLTGESNISFSSNQIFIDGTGAIKCCSLEYRDYFGDTNDVWTGKYVLDVYWFADLGVNDPMTKFLADTWAVGTDEAVKEIATSYTPGFNAYRIYYKDAKWTTAEKLD